MKLAHSNILNTFQIIISSNICQVVGQSPQHLLNLFCPKFQLPKEFMTYQTLFQNCDRKEKTPRVIST